jgi:hypothetical protein
MCVSELTCLSRQALKQVSPMTTLTHALQRHLPWGGTLDPRIKHAPVVARFVLVGVSVLCGIEAAVGAMADANLAGT